MTSSPTSDAVAIRDDDDDDRPSAGQRLREWLMAPVRLARAMFLPDRWLPVEVGAGRAGAAMLALFLCGMFGALAVGSRLDVSADVMREAAQSGGMREEGGPGGGGPGAGSAPAMSDREIQEEITKRLGVERVMRALKDGLGRPGKVLILALVIYLIGTYVGGKPVMRRALSAAAHAALPMAVASIVLGVAALSQESLTPAQADALVGNPLAPLAEQLGAAGRLVTGVDPFFLWSVLLLGFGLAAAADITRRRAFLTLAVCLALFLCLSNVVCASPPEGGMGGGPGGPRGPR
jgi:hypothetical protein